MSKRRGVLMAVVALVAAVGIFWGSRPAPEPAEPTYDGVPLQVWLNVYAGMVRSAESGKGTSMTGFSFSNAIVSKSYVFTDADNPAPMALKAIGKDAIPYLYERLRRPVIPDVPIFRRYVEFASKLPPSLRDPVAYLTFPRGYDSDDRVNAAIALRLPVFRNPETVRLLVKTVKGNDAAVRAAAGKSLRIVDPEAADKAGVK